MHRGLFGTSRTLLKRIGGQQASGHTIITITDDGGAPLVTTAAPHGLNADDSIVVSGTTLYDGSYLVTPTSAASFDLQASYLGDDAGGSWQLS